MVLVGCILAFKTRNLSSALGEAKQLLFAMYNVGLVAAIVMLMGSFLDVDQKSVYVIEVVGIFWATVFSSCAFVLPRLLQVQKRASTRNSVRNVSSIYQNGYQPSTSFYSSPMVMPAGFSSESGIDLHGGSLRNEPRSKVPNSSISSYSIAFDSSEGEPEKSSNFKKSTQESSPNNIYDEHESFESDFEQDLQDSGEDYGGEKQHHRNTSFTKLSISASQSEILQELEEEEDKKDPAGGDQSMDSCDAKKDESVLFGNVDVVMKLKK